MKKNYFVFAFLFVFITLFNPAYNQTIYCMGQPTGTNGATANALNGSTVTINCGTTNNFRDPAGGAGGTTNYALNQTYTVTFCSGSSSPLYFDFMAATNSLNLDAGSGDSLKFYDTASGDLIATLTQSDDYGFSTPSVGTSSTCVTVVWISDGAGVDGGWDAVVSCAPLPASCSGGNPAASDIFLQAPTICNLDGYCGTTSAYYGEDAPYNFSGTGGGCPAPDALFGGTLQNNSWLQFQASATSITFTFTISGGGSCNGVQAGVFAFNSSTNLFGLMSGCASTNGSGLAPGISNLVASGLTIGSTYYLMMDGNAGSVCDYIINFPPGTIATINAGNDQTICSGSANLTATGPAGVIYNWTDLAGNPIGTGANQIVSPIVTTSYIVIGTGVCSNSRDTVIVNVASLSAPIIGTITQPTCSTPTGTVALSGLPAGAWTINPGAIAGSGTSTTISGLIPATYNFTVTAAGCSSTASLNAFVNAVPGAPTAPIIGTITQPTCSTPTGTVALSGLPAGAWTINPGAIAGSGTSTTISGLAPATYNFTVTAAGCASTASLNAVVNAVSGAPTAPVIGTITQPTCIIPTGIIALSGLPAGAWTINPGAIAGSGTSTTISGLAPATYNFTVTETLTGCTSTASLNALVNVVPAAPTAPLIGTLTQPTCIILTGTVALSGLPSGAWTINPGAIAGSGTSTTISGLAPATYNFTVTETLTGCTSTASLIALVNAVPAAPAAPLIGTITQPTCTTPTGTVALSGLPAGAWIINPGAVSGSGMTTTISGLAPATYNFTVTETFTGCTSTASLIALVNAVPAAPAAPLIGTITQPTCTTPTGTVALSGLPAGAWIINPGAVSGSGMTTTISGLSPATYIFTVTEILTGCTSNASLNTVVNAVPSAPAAPVANITNQPTCILQSGTIEIVSPIGANFQIYIDGIPMTVGTYIFSGLAPLNTYSITVVDLTTGCASSPFDVSINGIPSAEIVNAGPDYLIQSGETITLTASGNGTIIWNTGDPVSTNVSPTITTTYTATMTDVNGCIDSDFAIVSIDIYCGELFIPTAFSPNGDAVNSSFKIKINPDCVKEMNLKVFDRWGEVVFETTSPDGLWDGKFKGKELDSGVFVYVLEIMLDTDTELQKFKGNLTLIK